MEFLSDSINGLKNVSLVLGFFDGVHLGHVQVISTAVNHARENSNKSVLITFKKSPAEYFLNKFEYIYSRDYSYNLISELGVDYLYEMDFEKVLNISAEDYIDKFLIAKFNPKAILTGFNHTFGKEKKGTPELIKAYSLNKKFEYHCIEPIKIDGEIVSSTKIRELIRKGDIETANIYLGRSYTIKSKVIRGLELGRKLGFPTANMLYPSGLVKLPYGVYLVKVLGRSAIMNWGIKPTIGEYSEILEVHIPNFSSDLYGMELEVDIVKKIRDEKRFDSIDELKIQIEKDIIECLEL